MQRKSSETFPLREYLFKKMNTIIKDCKSIHFSTTRMYILMYQECTFLRYKKVYILLSIDYQEFTATEFLPLLHLYGVVQ